MRFVMQTMGQYPDAFMENKVLEVGSLNINGSVRGFFFNAHEYIGCDVGPGPGVDIVCPGEELTYPDNYFDTSITTECFEHNPNWVETFENMWRMTRPGGLIVMTCAAEGRPEHGTSRSDIGSSPLTVENGQEYYKNLMEPDFRREFDLDNMFKTVYFEYEPYAYDLYFRGVVHK
jgi:SAM-dependent methyltransferase